MIMPLVNGMDTARELRQADTAVRLVFLTSSPEFALESYEVRAFGYLLKPVWMVLTGRNAHKGTKIVFLTKVIHVLAEFLYCLFLFFCNHFC